MPRGIATIRKTHGLSQTALAAKVNVTQTVISRIETGNRQLLARELPLFAQALGCTIEDLLGNLSPQANTPEEEKGEPHAVSRP